MNRSRIILFGCSLILFLGLVFSESIVQASEVAGGRITTKGNISFYEDSTESSSSNSQTVSKPIRGKLPSTGEQIRMLSFIGGCLLFLALLLLFLQKRRREKKK